MKGITLTTSRLHATPPATTSATCNLLSKGVQHRIADRPSISESVHTLAMLHAQGKRFAPTIRLRNGEVRKIVAAAPSKITNEELEFEGLIANGNDLVKVTVRFLGSSSTNGVLIVQD
jgi:hypothetical protein